MARKFDLAQAKIAQPGTVFLVDSDFLFGMAEENNFSIDNGSRKVN